MRMKQAKQLRILAMQFGAKTKTEAKAMLKQLDRDYRDRLEREP